MLVFDNENIITTINRVAKIQLLGQNFDVPETLSWQSFRVNYRHKASDMD